MDQIDSCLENYKEIFMCQSVFPCCLVIFLVDLDPGLGDNYNVNYSHTLELNSSDVRISVMTRPKSEPWPFLLFDKGLFVKFLGSQDSFLVSAQASWSKDWKEYH